jgi:3-isopropylmalate dehydrogenase
MNRPLIAVLPGDGIGPEVMAQGLLVLEKVSERFGFGYVLEEGLLGGCAIDRCGEPFPEETQELARRAAAVLLGAVGGPKWDGLPGEQRPEQGGLLGIRRFLGLYANLRPVRCYPELLEQSPFKNERARDVDLLVVRELIGGAYFGERGKKVLGGTEVVFDTIEYSEASVRQLAEKGFELAEARRKKLTSVDKANVLDTSRLWRRVVEETAKAHPGVTVEHMYVDNCAMQLCLNPGRFDVIVTENMFGDILSDQASVLGASLGMLPSASLGNGRALYEPAHGSAPEIAGRNAANPIAMILSVAQMLRISLNLPEAASAVERAVAAALADGWRTRDIAGPGDGVPEGGGRQDAAPTSGAGDVSVAGTREMGQAVLERL